MRKGCFVRNINCCKDRSSHFCLGNLNFSVSPFGNCASNLISSLCHFLATSFRPCGFGTSFNGVGVDGLGHEGDLYTRHRWLWLCFWRVGCAAAAGLVGGLPGLACWQGLPGSRVRSGAAASLA